MRRNIAGFRWRRTEDNRKILVEAHDIRILKTKFLLNMQYWNEGMPIIYTDERYLHSSYANCFTWYDDSEKGCRKFIFKGKHWIIVHAGDACFIPETLRIYKSLQTTADYYDMNSTNFKKWLENHLISNLPPKEVLVLDNAFCHNVQVYRSPTSSSKKKTNDRLAGGKTDTLSVRYDQIQVLPTYKIV